MIFELTMKQKEELRQWMQRPNGASPQFVNFMGDHVWMEAVEHGGVLVRTSFGRGPLPEAVMERTVLDWKRGPANGGVGTAGGTPEASVWYDGDRLLVVVELADGSRDVDVIHVFADEGTVSFRTLDDDAYGWEPESIAWFARLGQQQLPPKLSDVPTDQTTT